MDTRAPIIPPDTNWFKWILITTNILLPVVTSYNSYFPDGLVRFQVMPCEWPRDAILRQGTWVCLCYERHMLNDTEIVVYVCIDFNG